MKNFSQNFLLLFLLYTINFSAQVVDESINGVQIGFLGVWINNETKISKNWAFRSEIGYEAPLVSDLCHECYNGYFASGHKRKFPLFLPVLSFEPKWYYNSPMRQGNSKNTFHNSSNFASVNIRFYPEFGAISPHTIEEVDGGIFIIPTWGIRRNISYRLNYELGLGFGLDVYQLFADQLTTTEFIFNTHIRIGYKYGKKAFQEN